MNKKDKKKGTDQPLIPLSKEDKKLCNQLFDKYGNVLKGWLRKKFSLGQLTNHDDIEEALQEIFLLFFEKVNKREYQLVIVNTNTVDPKKVDPDDIYCEFPNGSRSRARNCLARIYTNVRKHYPPYIEPDEITEANLPLPKGEDNAPREDCAAHEILESHQDVDKSGLLETWIEQLNEQNKIGAMNDCINRLDAISIALFYLSYTLGMSHEQIAEKYGKQLNAESHATVSRRISRIKEHLQNCITSLCQ